MAKGVKAESLCGKETAGAPGRTLLELFPKKIWRFQSTIFRYDSGSEHPRPNPSTCQFSFGDMVWKFPYSETTA